MTTVTGLAFAGLGLAGLVCLGRLIWGPSLSNRIVALDVLLVIIVSGIAVGAVRSGDPSFLDVMVVAALLAFVGTVAVARVIESRAHE